MKVGVRLQDLVVAEDRVARKEVHSVKVPGERGGGREDEENRIEREAFIVNLFDGNTADT